MELFTIIWGDLGGLVAINCPDKLPMIKDFLKDRSIEICPILSSHLSFELKLGNVQNPCWFIGILITAYYVSFSPNSWLVFHPLQQITSVNENTPDVH